MGRLETKIGRIKMNLLIKSCPVFIILLSVLVGSAGPLPAPTLLPPKDNKLELLQLIVLYDPRPISTPR